MRPFGPWVIACSALLGCAAAIYGFWQRGLQIAELSSRLEQAERRADERLGDLLAKLSAAEKARVIAERAARENKPAAAAAGAAGPRAGFSPLNLSDMRKAPAYAAIWRRQQLRNIQRQYGDAFAALQGWQTPDPQTGLAPADEALLNQATQSLTSAQLPILRDYLLEVRQQQQYMQKRMAAARGGGG